jgi:predicted nucleotidyltransferase
MRRDQIIAKLKEAEPDIRAHGAAALYLFGSYARGDAKPNFRRGRIHQ